MPRPSGRQQRDAADAERVAAQTRGVKVAKMDRIEGAAEDGAANRGSVAALVPPGRVFECAALRMRQ